jgi:hypothetical protein
MHPTNFKGRHFLLQYACKLLLFHYLYIQNMVCYVLTCFSCMYKVVCPTWVTRIAGAALSVCESIGVASSANCLSVILPSTWRILLQEILGSAIASNTRQRHHQYDSTATSRHNQRRLSSASKTRQCHHQHALTTISHHIKCQHGSVVMSCHGQRRISSAIANMT